MSEWISVKDRLPDQHRIVLVNVNSWSFTACHDRTFGWVFYDPRNVDHGLEGTDDIQVTHWQPLPEPPKQEHNE